MLSRRVWLSDSRRREPKECVWWKDQVKARVKRKEVLGARDEDTREKKKR